MKNFQVPPILKPFHQDNHVRYQDDVMQCPFCQHALTQAHTSFLKCNYLDCPKTYNFSIGLHRVDGIIIANDARFLVKVNDNTTLSISLWWNPDRLIIYDPMYMNNIMETIIPDDIIWTKQYWHDKVKLWLVFQ